MSDSFSLPSASGMVSLLNDSGSRDKQKTRTRRLHPQHIALPLDDGRLSVSQSHSRRSGSSTSAYNSPSPFSSNPSAGESGSNGSSTAITVPSTDSSRDDSVDWGKLHAETRESSAEERPGSKSLSTTAAADGTQPWRQLPQRTDTAYSSSPSLDEERTSNESPSNESPPNGSRSADSKLSPNEGNDTADARVGKKRRRQTDTRADKTVQSRGVSMQKMLDSSRIARSPKPMRDDEDCEDDNGPEHEDDDGGDVCDDDDDDDDDEDEDNDGDKTARDVPMNMHRATAQEHGGFGGKTQMQKSDDNRAQMPYDGSASSSRQRSSIGSTTSSTAAKENASAPGRKAGSGLQIIGGKKRYPCSFRGCDKTFSTSGHAARHNRIHTGSKPYRCTFPGCHASFSRQDNSLQHYRTHVLHPKSRAGVPISLDASQSDPSAVDAELTHLDPETVATVQMGRKALEEGTAIAVVQEFIDGHGRRAEAVQRMVGQPKTGRRGSTTAQPDGASIAMPIHSASTSTAGAAEWDGHGPEKTHRRHVSASGRPSVTDQQLGWNSHVDMRPGQSYPSPPRMHAAWERNGAYAYPACADGPPPPQHGHGYMHGQAPPTHAHYPPYEHQHTQQPYFHHSPPQLVEDGGHMHSHSARDTPYHAVYRAPPPLSSYGDPASDTTDHGRRRSYASGPPQDPLLMQTTYYEEARGPRYAPTYGVRARRQSDTLSTSVGAAPIGPPPYSDHRPAGMPFSSRPLESHAASSLPPSTAPPPIDTAAAHYSMHRRSVSAVAPVVHRGEMPQYDEHGRPLTSHGMNEQRSPIDAPSPSYSVRSFRSEGPYAPSVPRDDRSSALSLLSNTAARSGSSKASSIPTLPLPGRARVSTKGDMHLTLPPPGPPPAMSKVPYSSDRSTNVLTPTPLPPMTTHDDRRVREAGPRGIARAV